jgi:hypothetical protein
LQASEKFTKNVKLTQVSLEKRNSAEISREITIALVGKTPVVLGLPLLT